MFDRSDIKNAKAERPHAGLNCTQCKTLIKCAACKKGYKKEYWSNRARKNTMNKGSALICKEYRARGCTPRSPELYTCTTCRKMFGAAQMDTISFMNFKHHGRPTLTCSHCVSAQKDRLKTLQTQLRKSSRKCTCFCPFHKALCPLTPCIYNEQRWPGSDGFISLDDKIFLDSLHPKPL